MTAHTVEPCFAAKARTTPAAASDVDEKSTGKRIDLIAVQKRRG